MKKHLSLLAFLVAFSSHAHALNCKTLWAKGYPDSRFPEGLECTLSKQIELDGLKADIYHYSAGFPRAPEDTGFTFRTEEVATEVAKTIMRMKGETSNTFWTRPISFIFTDHKAEGTEIAKVRPGHADDYETCPMVIYIDAFKKQTPERQRQMLAHEVFHCIQDSTWRDKLTGTAKSDHAWWVEGSAVWFSNIVYPDYNQEYDYNYLYEGNSSLVVQSAWPYSTYLFFQSLSQGWLDFRGTLSFLKSMPDSGGINDQIAAVTDFTSIELHFNNFAQQLTSGTVRDFNGVLIPSGMGTAPDRIKIAEGEQTIEWSNESLTIKIKELNLPAKAIISIDNQSDSPTMNPLSFRDTGSDDQWRDMYNGYPTSMDMSCKTFSKSIDVLSAYAGTEPLNEKFRLKIKTQPAECKCVETEKFEKCLTGDFELDKTSMDSMFKRIFRHKDFVVENTQGQYFLNVSSTQKFTFDLKGFSASVVVKDAEYGDRRVFVKLDGTTDAIGKRVSKNELCFSDIGDDLSVYTRIDFPSGSVEDTQPFPQFDDLTREPLSYTCSEKEIVLIMKLPTSDGGGNENHELRFVRK